MALSQSALSELLDAIRAGGSVDVMREAMTFVLRASADPMVSSPLMSSGYERQMPDYQSYLDRPMPAT